MIASLTKLKGMGVVGSLVAKKLPRGLDVDLEGEKEEGGEGGKRRRWLRRPAYNLCE